MEYLSDFNRTNDFVFKESIPPAVWKVKLTLSILCRKKAKNTILYGKNKKISFFA